MFFLVKTINNITFFAGCKNYAADLKLPNPALINLIHWIVQPRRQLHQAYSDYINYP